VPHIGSGFGALADLVSVFSFSVDPVVGWLFRRNLLTGSSAPPPAAVDRNCCCGESTNEYRGKDAHGQISRHAASSGCCTANGGPRHKFRIGPSERSLPVSGFALQPFGGRLVGIDLARIPLSQLSATEDDERENSEGSDEKDRKRQHGKKGEGCHGLTRQLVVKGGYQRS